MAESISLGTLNPKQAQVLDEISYTPSKGLLICGYGGEVRGGKTWLICRVGFQLSLQFPGNRIVIGMGRLKDLETVVMPEFFKLCPPVLIGRKEAGGGYYDAGEKCVRLRLPNWPEGVYSEIWFKPLSKIEEINGMTLGAFLADECNNIPEEVAEFAFTRLSHQLPPGLDPAIYEQYRRVYLVAQNPYPGWFTRWFNPLNPEKMRFNQERLHELGARAVFVNCRTEDNKENLPDNFADVTKALLTDNTRKRLMEGQWDAFRGRVFGNFDPDTHKWLAVTTPPFKALIGGLDFGGIKEDSHYTAGVLGGLSEKGRLIELETFKKRGPHVFLDQMEWMTRVERKWQEQTGQHVVWVADGTQITGIQSLRQRGFRVLVNKRTKDSWRTNVLNLAYRMEPDGNGIHGWFYMPHLTELEEEMREYSYDDSVAPDGSSRERPKKVNDDIIDAVLYQQEHPLLTDMGFDPAVRFKGAIAHVA